MAVFRIFFGCLGFFMSLLQLVDLVSKLGGLFKVLLVNIPLIRVDQQTYDKFCEGQRVKMDGDSGEITILA